MQRSWRPITDLSKLENLQLNVEECILGVKFNYSGKLPAEATITIPLGKELAGRNLYYYQMYEDGSYKYTGQSAVVDENGNYTIKQGHCSTYIISVDTPVVTPEQTGDFSNIFFYTMVLLVAGGGVFLAKKKVIRA